ncbi:hypothetical protein [Streptomyces sp. PR69]|uniref:hypothetical protein n=1 Tax=Streptomyces sp. PR69 TaxID=2984950 RepID=UPI002264C08D|nr:hypothetical protein [Streptomyces sp. PR69]
MAETANDAPDAPAAVDCCPQLEPCEPCDTLHIAYRLPYPAQVNDRSVPVEVTLRFVLQRCHGPLALGPLVYTTTLLPGEKVRLATRDRHSSFSFDSSSSLAHHHRSSSEESFYTAGMAHAVSDVSVVDSTRRESTYSESAVSGGGGAGLDLGVFEIGGSVKGSSFDASSVAESVRNFSRHAESSHHHVQAGVRAASSVSVGAVSSRAHREGESEDHFEASSRVFSNPNRCRALTFFFHQIVKCQTVKFSLAAIDLRVNDPAAPTGVTPARPRPLTGVQVVPQQVVATSPELVRTEAAARQAAVARTAETPAASAPAFLAAAPVHAEPPLKRQAIEVVRRQLTEQGLLNRDGAVSAKAQERYGWERELVLPTPGVRVRTCLDECEACEPELKKQMELELERLALENKLLARRIELMDKDQEHRCCPGEASSEGGGA